MTTLSPAQIAQYAYNAGFRGQDLIDAIAVALAESGGNPAAYNPETAAGTPQGSGSRGLWQIYGNAHPEYNNQAVYDPQANANAAFKIQKQAGSFAPWSTFKNGSFLKYYSPALAATNVIETIGDKVKSQLPSGTPTGITDTVTAIAAPVNAVANSGAFDLANLAAWADPIRIAKLIAGLAIVIVVIAAMIMSNPQVKQATKDVAEVAAA